MYIYIYIYINNYILYLNITKSKYNNYNKIKNQYIILYIIKLFL